jgi:ribulose-phosphate 3-epimerase
MKIIPVINCQDFDCVKARISLAQEFLCDHGSENRTVSSGDEGCFIHLDVADGGFTNGYTTWRNPAELKAWRKDSHLSIEVHLMLTEPELSLEAWLDAGVSRIIVHLEAATSIDTIAAMCAGRGVELWLALAPATPAEKAFPYLSVVQGCQVLAVEPGRAGQAMLPGTLEKVSALRAAFPELPIEVDGGITPATVPLCKDAGATQVVAGSAIFNAPDPATAYRDLYKG